MDKFQISGTSALKTNRHDINWNLWKVDAQNEHESYVLTMPDANALPTVARVMHALLDGNQIAMICEKTDDSFSRRFMSYLTALCGDGRILKQGQGSAFIALCSGLEEDLLSASLLGARAENENPRFRFVGFPEAVPAEYSFNALLERSRTSGIEVVFDGTEELTLHISFDPAQFQACEVIGAVRNVITASGGAMIQHLQ